MVRSFIILLVVLLSGLASMANNVRIMGDVTYDPDDLTKGNVLKLKFTLVWDNSWRDDYNWDAVYVCFKYKVAKPNDTYMWKHIYLNEFGNSVSGDFSYTLAKAKNQSTAVNTGAFFYRKYNGGGEATLIAEVAWDISTAGLTKAQFDRSEVLVSATGIEMVYVPTGAFKIGDSESAKTFRKTHTPIPEEYDIVHDEYDIFSSGGETEHPELAADRINDNEPTNSSCWTAGKGTDSWWRIDFGPNQADWKAISFFGVNASKSAPDSKPALWALYGSNDKGIVNMDTPLWQGGAEDWVVANDAYPIERAIKVPNPQPYRYYHIYIRSMRSGSPVVKSIGMTDRSVDKLLDYSVLVDSPTTVIDSLKGIGARDGENWTGGATFPAYPNGFLGFYAMKYEISQEQYVKFLNKLSRGQQDALLPQINKQGLVKGNYIFGDKSASTARNGILISDKEGSTKPYLFADSLEIAVGDALSIHGETIACNYMSVNDMLAYADWVGLRPLSEMEFEKISRRPFPTIPLKREFAWNTTKISLPTGIANPGTNNETAIGGNANYGGVPAIGGPLRVGAFSAGKTVQEAAGVSFYGAMDLSGNLSEICYNANTEGRKFKAFTDLSHGDGMLITSGLTGEMMLTDVAISTWPQNAAKAFTIRGGSYKDSDRYLAISDRSRNMDYFPNNYTRNSDVSFRLGYSEKAAQEQTLDVFLTLQNGRTSKQSVSSDTICGYTSTYTIVGNRPQIAQGSYTFIWYMLEDGGAWRILEGENDQGLTFSGFVNNLTRLKRYQFKRLMITPVNYAMTAPVSIIVDQVANAQISSLKDTIDGYGRSQGGFYAASTINSKFIWRWVYRGRALTLNPYATTATSSHYVPSPEQFKLPDGSLSYGENLVQMERTTEGLNSCYTTVDLKVFIKKDKPVAMPSTTVKCGNYMRDARDGQEYPTVAIGGQCWMARNLNYSGGGIGTCYESNSENCKVFGRMYTWFEANLSVNPVRGGICPKGWHIPINREWDVLRAALSDPGKKLKASKYWSFVNMNLIGANAAKFNAIPGGYFVPEKRYLGMNDYARWWTADVLKVSNRRVRIAGWWSYCYGHQAAGYPGCSITRWTPPVYETYYNYDGYFIELLHTSNEMKAAIYFRNNGNGYNSDKLYLRCVKD